MEGISNNLLRKFFLTKRFHIGNHLYEWYYKYKSLLCYMGFFSLRISYVRLILWKNFPWIIIHHARQFGNEWYGNLTFFLISIIVMNHAWSYIIFIICETGLYAWFFSSLSNIELDFFFFLIRSVKSYFDRSIKPNIWSFGLFDLQQNEKEKKTLLL